jgi:hypothetical protein
MAEKTGNEGASGAHIKEEGSQERHAIVAPASSEGGLDACDHCGEPWAMHLRDWNGTAHCRQDPCRCMKDDLRERLEAIADRQGLPLPGDNLEPANVMSAICVHEKPPWECQKCADFHEQCRKYGVEHDDPAQIEPDRASRLAASAKSAAVRLGKTRFRLDRLRVSRVNLDSEPSRRMTETARALGHERPEGHDWVDIVITVTDTSGNVFEVGRVPCKYDGMLGESTAAAELVVRKSWGGEEDDDTVSCPLCYERGHGAGACPRS